MAEGKRTRGHASAAAVAPLPRQRVLLPLPLADAYDYRVPAGLHVGPGAFVSVPLGGREMLGVAWDGEPDPALPEKRLRNILAVLDAPPMTATLRRFVDWVAAYTLSPPGAVLRMAMSAPSALEAPAPQAGWRKGAAPQGVRITPTRQRVLDVLADGAARAGGEIAEAAGVTPAVLRGMADAGLIEPALLARRPRFVAPDPDRPGPALGPEQHDAAEALKASVARRALPPRC